MIQLLNDRFIKLKKRREHEENGSCSIKQPIHFMVDKVDKEKDHVQDVVLVIKMML